MLHYQPNKELGETSATALARSGHGGPKPHVLLAQTQAENAGAQEISRLLGAGLTARGYRVTNLFFFRKSDSFDEPPDTLYCAQSRPGNPVALLQMLRTLGRHIRATRPDAVLTFQHFGNVIGGGVTRLVSRAPVVANQVSSAMSMSWPVRTADIVMGSLGFFDCITLNSKDMQREYSRYPAAYRSRMVHVPHGFDDKALTLSKEAARQRFNLPPDCVLLGCAARLHPHKRLDLAIRLLPDQPSWRLALAGQGADEARLRQLASDLRVSDRLHWLRRFLPAGWRTSWPAWTCSSFRHRPKPSVWPLSGRECRCSLGRDRSSRPARSVVLRRRPTALFVDASDHAKLSAAVSTLLTDKHLSDELRQNAKGLRLRYSVDAMVDEYVRILEQVI